MSWHHEPAATVEYVIREFTGHYPPTLEELEELARFHNYTVIYWPSDILPEPMIDLRGRLIELPAGPPERCLPMLLHEIAEMLLRLDVAPEYYFPPTGRDEHHHVALAVNRRAAPQLHPASARWAERHS